MKLANSKYATVGDLEVHYTEAGAGPAVLLVHGLGSSWITWKHNIEPLAEAGYWVLALDLPGNGDSDKPRNPISYDPRTTPSLLKGFLEANGVERATVVGHSAGGLMAVLFALAHPQMVEKVVLASSAGLSPKVPWFFRLLSVPVLGEVLYQPRLLWGNQIFKRIFYRPPPFLYELMPEIRRVRNLPGSRYAFIRCIRSSINLLGLRKDRQILPDLKRLQAPLMIVWGREDVVIPASHATLALDELPQSAVHIFPECGHWPHMEKSEEFNAHLLRFLLDSDRQRTQERRQ